MKKSVFSRLTIIGFGGALITMALATQAAAQSGESGNVKTSIQSVVALPGGAVVPAAGSSLSRRNDGVFFTFHTAGLVPGTAVTAWLVAFNNPKSCATTPCTPADLMNPDVEGSLLNTGGRVIGQDGAATYGAYRAVGDTTGADFGPGLLFPKSAEIHLVLRSHGPASLDPAVLNLQLTTFNGGCPPNTCMNVQASRHLP